MGGNADLDYTYRHSHEFEVKSGMLVLPKPSKMSAEEWEAAELDAMNEVVGLYGKTWHFWQVDRGDEFPLGKLAAQIVTRRRVSEIFYRSPSLDGFNHQFSAAPVGSIISQEEREARCPS